MCHTDKQVRLMIENKEGNTIGTIDLTSFDPKNRRAEIGIVISPNYRGYGYAKASLSQIHQYATNVAHIHQLYAIIPESHDISKSLFSKMGYIETSRLVDWLYDGNTYTSAVIFQKILYF